MFNRKKDILNAWIPIILFVAIFVTMLVIATFKDLDPSLGFNTTKFNKK